MRFTGQFAAPRLDVARYRATLVRAMQDTIKQAVEHWLSAVLVRIPVWSGASFATFEKLATSAGFTFNSPTPVAASREWQGRNQSRGSVAVDQPPGHFTFTYHTSLPWLLWNEYHNANEDPDPTLIDKLRKPGPYEFQAKGLMAFLNFAKTVDLPSVAPSITVTKINVG